MKRILILALLYVVLISQVVYSAGSSSLSVNGAIGKIIDEFTADDKLFYIYNEADEGAFLSVYFGLFSKNRQRYNLYRSEGNFIKSVNENIPKSELNKRNVVIFGGPCANKYWGEFSNETCENWPYKPGQSVVKVVDNNGYLALLIAGTDKKDTFEIARLVLQYNINNYLNQGSTYLHNSESKRVINFDKCKQETRDFTCLMFYYNAEFIYRKNGNDYAIILNNINDVDNVITFTLNGIPYSLELGESIVNNNLNLG